MALRLECPESEVLRLARVAASAIRAECVSRRLTSAPVYWPDGGRKGIAVRLVDGTRDRGCYAWHRAVARLDRAASLAALRAAFFDRRHAPVSPTELHRLEIEITVFAAWRPMVGPHDFVMGLHSVLVSFGDTFTLMQAQIPMDRGWSPEAFLDALCVKVGKAPGTWRDPRVRFKKSASIHLRLPFSKAAEPDQND
jgi:AMMECR1 domain-containing protein